MRGVTHHHGATHSTILPRQRSKVMQIPDTIAVKQLSDVPAMVAAALQYAYGNRAIYFEGTLFEQGGRVMFSTAMGDWA